MVSDDLTCRKKTDTRELSTASELTYESCLACECEQAPQ